MNHATIILLMLFAGLIILVITLPKIPKGMPTMKEMPPAPPHPKNEHLKRFTQIIEEFAEQYFLLRKYMCSMSNPVFETHVLDKLTQLKYQYLRIIELHNRTWGNTQPMGNQEIDFLMDSIFLPKPLLRKTNKGNYIYIPNPLDLDSPVYLMMPLPRYWAIENLTEKDKYFELKSETIESWIMLQNYESVDHKNIADAYILIDNLLPREIKLHKDSRLEEILNDPNQDIQPSEYGFLRVYFNPLEILAIRHNQNEYLARLGENTKRFRSKRTLTEELAEIINQKQENKVEPKDLKIIYNFNTDEVEVYLKNTITTLPLLTLTIEQLKTI